MAQYLIDTQQDGPVLDERLANSNQKTCPMYKPESNDHLRGRCTAYSFRPTVCRAFGSSYRSNKTGAPQFLGCKYIREGNPEIDALTEKTTLSNANVNHMKQNVLNAIDDPWLREERPFAAALKEALLFMRWQNQITYMKSGDNHTAELCVNEPRPTDQGFDQ